MARERQGHTRSQADETEASCKHPNTCVSGKGWLARELGKALDRKEPPEGSRTFVGFEKIFRVRTSGQVRDRAAVPNLPREPPFPDGEARGDPEARSACGRGTEGERVKREGEGRRGCTYPWDDYACAMVEGLPSLLCIYTRRLHCLDSHYSSG